MEGLDGFSTRLAGPDVCEALTQGGYPVLCSTLMWDVDPGTGEEHVATEEWKRSQVEALEACSLSLMGLAWYGTRNGIRAIVRLADPIPAKEAARLQFLAGRLLRSEGVEVEPIETWNLPYRAAYVVRDGERLAPWTTHRIDNVGVLDVGALLEKAAPLAADPQEQARGPVDMEVQEIKEYRNETLFRVACKLRRQGLAEVELYAALAALDRNRCESPLQNEKGGKQELRNIVTSAMRYNPDSALCDVSHEYAALRGRHALVREGIPTGEDVVFDIGDDDEVSSWILNAMTSSPHLVVFDQGAIRRYKDGLWEPLDEATVTKMFALLRGAQVFAGVRNNEAQYRTFRINWSKTESTRKYLERRLAEPNFFNNAPAGLLMEDSFVRVEDGRIVRQSPRPEHRATYRATATWVENPSTPRTDKFLYSLFESTEGEQDRDDKIRLFWEFLGAALLGKAAALQQAILVYGKGHNGKSQLIEIMRACFEEKHITSIPPQQVAQEYRLAALAQAKINLAEEVPDDDVETGAVLKSLITGSPLTARHIRQAPFEFRPSCAFVFSANDLPVYRDTSLGFQRRWLILCCDVLFSVEERVLDIGKKIAAEERSQIICKAVQHGVNALTRGRYIEPSSSQKARAGWAKLSDQVSAFLEDSTQALGEEDALTDSGTRPGDMYNAYKAWARASGHGILNKVKFARRLVALGVKKHKSGNSRYWNRMLVRSFEQLN